MNKNSDIFNIFQFFNQTFDEKIESLYGNLQMEIDMRRMKLIRLYCDKPENIRDCLKASETTHIKYNGKDDRNYNPIHIKDELQNFTQTDLPQRSAESKPILLACAARSAFPLLNAS